MCTGEHDTWLAQNFAQQWYLDACNEANTNTLDARRREIIFAVACIESYLVEWVRDCFSVDCLNEHLAPIEKKGINERWKLVIKELCDKKEYEAPCFKTGKWSEFTKYIKYRNSLLHGNMSKPYIQKKNNDSPTFESLSKLKPGAASGIVYELILELSQVTNTQIPTWCERPSF